MDALERGCAYACEWLRVGVLCTSSSSRGTWDRIRTAEAKCVQCAVFVDDKQAWEVLIVMLARGRRHVITCSVLASV